MLTLLGQEQQAVGRQLLAFLTDSPSPEHPERMEGNVMRKGGEEGVPQICLANGSSCWRRMLHWRKRTHPSVCVRVRAHACKERRSDLMVGSKNLFKCCSCEWMKAHRSSGNHTQGWDGLVGQVKRKWEKMKKHSCVCVFGCKEPVATVPGEQRLSVHATVRWKQPDLQRLHPHPLL